MKTKTCKNLFYCKQICKSKLQWFSSICKLKPTIIDSSNYLQKSKMDSKIAIVLKMAITPDCYNLNLSTFTSEITQIYLLLAFSPFELYNRHMHSISYTIESYFLFSFVKQGKEYIAY